MIMQTFADKVKVLHMLILFHICILLLVTHVNFTTVFLKHVHMERLGLYIPWYFNTPLYKQTSLNIKMVKNSRKTLNAIMSFVSNQKQTITNVIAN